MSCEVETLYVETVVVKRINPVGYTLTDVLDYEVRLTLENDPLTTILYEYPADITKVAVDSQLELTIPSTGAKSIVTPGKYFIEIRMTDALGIRGIAPCPAFLRFNP